MNKRTAITAVILITRFIFISIAYLPHKYVVPILMYHCIDERSNERKISV